MQKPLRLEAAQAWRSYLGGKLIAALHGKAGEDDHFPEEWLLSTAQARNLGREEIVEGLSCTADGETLRDLIAQNPEAMLGKGRTETGMLMKLIDSAERLAMQVHPTKQDARRLFHSAYGKTECWHILGGRTIDGQAPHIYIGFVPGVTPERWAELFDKQDIEGLLSCLHRIPVEPGQTYLVHGGVPHAIGAGCFLAEIQEPTDITLRVEKTNAAGQRIADASCHQGIGYDNMLQCFDYTCLPVEEVMASWCIQPQLIRREEGQYEHIALLTREDTEYFRLEKLIVMGEMPLPLEDVYSGLYVLEGEGELVGADYAERLSAGSQLFIPAECAAGVIRAKEPLTILRFSGPFEA